MSRYKYSAILFFGALISSGFAASNSTENAAAMAQKYRDLAKSYQALADQYQKEADAQQTPAHTDVTSTKASTSTPTTTAVASDKATSASTTTNKDTTDKTAQNTVSPWEAKRLENAKASSQSSNTDTTKSDTSHLASLKQGESDSVPQSIIDDEQIKKPTLAVAEPWKGTNFGLGGSMTTGNSAATNYNANANLSYTPIVPWQNTLTMNYNYSRDDTADNVKTNKFQAFGKSAWNFDKNNGVYGSINYLKDQLDTYVYVVTESFGYQRLLYGNDKMTLSVLTGPSLTQQQVQNSGEFTNSFGWQSGLDYVWNFTDSSSLKQSIIVNYTGSNGTTYTSNSTLSTQLYKNLSLQLSFIVNGSSWAEAGKKRVGTTTTTSLLYTF
ncbi:DUF481 domain-containing protein [Fangia hongkongensis]|uniref:DUF481 domain-containing protein n=1 Tax=Fangia hongkongensis TaxID=270495 RepID=UPI00036AF1AF|nr:DUF481 domain-containing protein [Fangia hongkongensis]MBK2125777.1 DUF481 domain-containing protein [Fangia hongkongensis]